LDGVRWVIGNSDKPRIAELLSPAHEAFHGRVLVSPFERGAEFRATPVRDARQDRARPNLKIQDGCNNRCAFCVIPAVRGPSRSASVESILSQIRELSARYPEIVLTGINLGRWGRDLPDHRRFSDLLQRILNQTDVQRLRLSSVEPMDWTESLIRLMADKPRIAPHVHMPLQSGSDSVLKRMFRRYRTRHYAARLEFAHGLMPDAAFGADVMTGFPGETEAEFRETVSFIEDQPFTYLHVFTYSERPGTRAAESNDVVPGHVRRERTHVLRQIGERKSQVFRERLAGRTLSAITLEEPGVALTENYIRVRMARPRPPHQITCLETAHPTPDGLAERGFLQVL
jgi:threonylcarbamoyladenosine tRNA methylthiotransferase MtaB